MQYLFLNCPLLKSLDYYVVFRWLEIEQVRKMAVQGVTVYYKSSFLAAITLSYQIHKKYGM